MKKSHLKATSLRSFMIIIIILVISASAAGFYFAQNWLKKAAIEYNQAIAASIVANNNKTPINKLQADIAQYQPVVDKANNIFTPSQDYQSKTISDLKKYASISNINISDYSFEKSNSNSGSSSKESAITITISNPVKLSDLAKFIKGIETNSPKMQLTGINISRSTNAKGLISVKPLTIKVYTK